MAVNKIKNYTSSIPVAKIVSNIEKMLIDNGAKDILKNYTADKELSEISFRIERHNKSFSFRLPANVYAAARVMYGSDRVIVNNEKKKQQAQRTAWKCVNDWVELQMAMVQMQQMDLVEVFLSQMYNGQKTFYKQLSDNSFGGMGTALNS